MKRVLIFFLLIALPLLVVAQKKKNEPILTAKPFNLGLIHELQSKILNEKRTLNIYLPEGYSEKDTVTYPVIYLLDGSADEDFIHVVGLVQFANFSWVNIIPKSIVVGIANTNRKRDFSFPTSVEYEKKNYPTTGGSENFISFIENELQPYIEKTFKTKSDKMIIGQSLAGLLATEILFKKPYLFSKYLIISPSLWWNDASILKLQPAVLDESYKQKTNIYIAVGKEGLAPTQALHVCEVEANMLADKLRNTTNTNIFVDFDYLPDENHASIGHLAIYNGFKALFGKSK